VTQAALDHVERGFGAPLVLVHGSASDRRTWGAQLEAFAARFRVIAYSRRYHWPNAPIPEGADYSMSEHVDDLRDLLDRLGAAPAHLVGHSYGAFVCLLLAAREPERVRSCSRATRRAPPNCCGSLRRGRAPRSPS
jgi:pimeloyl-ACP methyl ester carboxylesterase